ncbi:MAG: imidazole glycerol phosphate synthase subunit HisH [Crocinitomicaceae bacterium]|nr:imidazole glycerol phosphate synthase subunit HisH [Crocinitomicaceae bacterium]
MIAIIKYNAGNIASVQNSLNRMGYESILTDDPREILSADKVIFPGVGEASSAMNYLKQHGLDRVLLQVEKPFLGICLGLQLMCRSSEEGDTKCLGIFDAVVRKFPSSVKVPHMGWSELVEPFTNSLINESFEDFYFVHSYYAEVNKQTTARCNYGVEFSAMIQKDNYYGMQFHPEKSGEVGEELLSKFLKL